MSRARQPQPSPVRRQLVRIARLLDVEERHLRALAGLPLDDLRLLHDRIFDQVCDRGSERYRRLAGLSGTLPVAATAKLAHRFMPPVVGARATEAIDPDYGVQMVARLPLDYVVDVALLLEPGRASELLRALPAERIAEIAAVLFERDELVVLAELASVLTDEALQAAIEATEPADLARLAPWLDEGPAGVLAAHLADG